MTLDQADAARRRAVAMLENFGDSTGAAEFEDMTPEEYADHKGIEIVYANPKRSQLIFRRNNMAKSKALTDAHDTIKDIYDTVQEAGSTRAEQSAALDKIADLCTSELPELDEGDDEQEDLDLDGDDGEASDDDE